MLRNDKLAAPSPTPSPLPECTRCKGSGIDKIIQEKKIIAEFMTLNEYMATRYKESWDWLFPVIDKINGMGKAYSFAIFKSYVSLTVEKMGNKFYKDFSFSHAEYITSEQTCKEATYKLIVKFIKWHNENKSEINLVESK